MESNYTFKNLNFWRKLYLILLYLLAILIIAGTGLVLINQGVGGVNSFQLVYFMVLIGLIFWTHSAVVSRNVPHLKWLAFFHLFPLMNIVSALIMLSIVRVSKKEIANDK